MKNCLPIILSILVLANAFTVSAQTDNADKKPDPDAGLPKSGVLSTSVTAGYQNKKVEIPWNKDGASAQAEAPISGSVSRESARSWKMKVFNNSEDAFDVSVQVKQIDLRAQVVKTDSFSFKLKSKESTERSMSAPASSNDARLELVSWKRLRSASSSSEQSSSEASSYGSRRTVVSSASSTVLQDNSVMPSETEAVKRQAHSVRQIQPLGR